MKIKSPLGNHNVNQPNLRTFSVQDETQNFESEDFTHQNDRVPDDYWDIPPNAKQIDPQLNNVQRPPRNQPQQNVRQIHNAAPPSPPQYFEGRDALRVREELLNKARRSSGPSHSVQNQINAVLGIGRGYTSATIGQGADSVTFKMRTLKGSERKYLANLINMAVSTKSPDSMYDIRDNTLALAIYEIQGVDFDVFLDCYGLSGDEILGARVNFVSELDSDIANVLHDKFQALSKEHVAGLSLDTPEQVKEVAQAVRKSSKDQ